VGSLSLSLQLAGLAACSASPLERPNIVLIIGEDHGFRDFGFMGNALVKTPHLDQLAARGTVFTTAYNTASSSRPSRMSLLTGLQPYQVKLREEQLAATSHERGASERILFFRTMPDLLAQRGYRSFQAGRLEEGTSRQAGFTSGDMDGRYADDGREHRSGGDAGLEVDVSTLQSIWDFLESQEQSEHERPFLLWFSPMLPQVATKAPAEYRDRYAGAELTRSALAYYANLARLDDAVGELVAKLEAMDALDRTLIVYLASNGWDNTPDADYARARGAAIGGTHGKLSMHELGFRTPIVFHWSGRVPAGEIRNELVSTLDLLPTLLDYAGLAALPGREGVSLRPCIEQRAEVPDRTLYGSMEQALSSHIGPDTRRWKKLRRRADYARGPRWHYVSFPNVEDGPFGAEQELYDMAADPQERHNLAAERPDVTTKLHRQLDAWKDRMRRSLPAPGARGDQWESTSPGSARTRGPRRL
jgi:uncharacterized sulfatase